MEALQAVANATYAQPQWLTATATQRKEPPRNDIQRPGPPKFKHTLYTTYYYDPQHRPITVNNNAKDKLKPGDIITKINDTEIKDIAYLRYAL